MKAFCYKYFNFSQWYCFLSRSVFHRPFVPCHCFRVPHPAKKKVVCQKRLRSQLFFFLPHTPRKKTKASNILFIIEQMRFRLKIFNSFVAIIDNMLNATLPPHSTRKQWHGTKATRNYQRLLQNSFGSHLCELIRCAHSNSTQAVSIKLTGFGSHSN